VAPHHFETIIIMNERRLPMRRITTFLIVFFTVFSSGGLVFANDNSFGKPSVGDVLGDVLCIRPLGAVELAFNSVFFVVSLPVTIPLKKTKEAEAFFIKDPYNFYFNRGLGEPIGKM
jgi:hypothetical protein